MKFLFILILLINTHVFAKSTIEFSSSFITHHFYKDNADRFENKISYDGRTIANPLYGVSLTWGNNDKYNSLSLFSGEDSIGSPMNGFMLSTGWGSLQQSNLHLGVIWGLYFYEEEAWEERYYDRTNKTPSWLHSTYGEEYRGINMIFGIELNYQIQLSNNHFVKFRNTFTPLISNHSIALGFNF